MDRMLFVWLFMYVARVYSTAVLGIDFGEDIRIGLIKVGQRSPMDLILNEESMRKSSALVAVTKDEVFVASAAQSIATRMPSNAYGLLKTLFGKRVDGASAQFQQVYFHVPIVEDPEREGALSIAVPGHDMPFTVEELASHIFMYVKKTAQIAAPGEDVSNCVITVPPYFDVFARNALLDAAQLAGFSVLELMHDVTAGAYRYALGVKTDQDCVFANFGATSTSAARISFKTSNSTYVSLKVHSYDAVTVGGLDVDLKIRDNVIHKFAESYTDIDEGEVRRSVKTMHRVLREANRAKHALSIAPDVTLHFDNLFNDKDFMLKLTRDDVALLCKEHSAIYTSLLQSMVTPQAQSTVVVGGNSRVGFVQSLLKDPLLPALATNINADEAVALGACLRAAVLSRKFVVTQDIRIEEHFPFKVTATHDNKDIVLFEALDTKKIVSFKALDDLTLPIKYSPQSNLSFPVPPLISTLHVKNVSSIVNDVLARPDLDGEPVVKIAMKLSSSGLVQVDSAYLSFQYLKNVTIIPPPQKKDEKKDNKKDEKKEEKQDDKKDEKKDETKENEKNNESKDKKDTDGKVKEENMESKTEEANVEKTDETVENKKEENGTDKETAEPTFKLVKKTKTIDLPFSHDFVMPRLSPLQIAAARERAQRFESFRVEKLALETRRNDVESAMYQFRDRLQDEEWTTFMAVETQDAITRDLDRIEALLHTAPLDALDKELSILQGWLRPIEARRTNHKERPAAIETLKQTLSAAEKNPEENVLKLVKETKEWLELRITQQDTLPTFETPILWAKDIIKKNNALLEATKKPEPKKEAKKENTQKKEEKSEKDAGFRSENV